MTSMLEQFTGLPELGLFLAVGLGYWLGAIKIGTFSFGTATAALIVGLVLGNVWDAPSTDIRSAFFLMFLFANGYSVGPQFANAVSQAGLKPMVLSLVVFASGVGSAVALAKGLGLDTGITAGLYSGGMTASAAIGTANDAIDSLALPDDARVLLRNNVIVADALCYVFGAIGVILFTSVAIPAFLGIDLGAESRKLEAELGMDNQQAGVFSAKFRFTARSFQLADGSAIIGRRVGDVEGVDPGRTVFIARIRRGDTVTEAGPDDVLARGDIVALLGHTAAVVEFGDRHGSELVDENLLDFPIEVLKTVVTQRDITNKTASELRQMPEARFVAVRSVSRGGEQLPLGASTKLERGDVVEMIGPVAATERAANRFGYPLRPGSGTPLSVVGFGILIGALLGMPFLMLGTFKLTLGISVGVLLSGLVAGWLRSIRPVLPTVPEPAVQLMISLGLAVFVAGAGMQAGPHFLEAVRQLGITILLAGVVVTLVPQILAFAVGRYVLRMNPVLLLGALAGAQTYTGALAAVQDKAGSRIAVLGYTVPYATSSILLTTGGAIVVGLMN